MTKSSCVLLPAETDSIDDGRTSRLCCQETPRQKHRL